MEGQKMASVKKGRETLTGVVRLRVSGKAEKIIREVADSRGMSISAFIRWAAMRAAHAIKNKKGAA